MCKDTTQIKLLILAHYPKQDVTGTEDRQSKQGRIPEGAGGMPQ